MRKTVLDIVEKARIVSIKGYYPGEHYGAFIFKRESSFIFVIAGKGEYGVWPYPGDPWDHVSVSVRDENRCPTWPEMCFVKNLFFEDDEMVIQFHPQKKDYVNIHEFVLHLWKPTESIIPMPPKGCI